MVTRAVQLQNGGARSFTHNHYTGILRVLMFGIKVINKSKKASTIEMQRVFSITFGKKKKMK